MVRAFPCASSTVTKRREALPLSAGSASSFGTLLPGSRLPCGQRACPSRTLHGGIHLSVPTAAFYHAMEEGGRLSGDIFARHGKGESSAGVKASRIPSKTDRQSNGMSDRRKSRTSADPADVRPHDSGDWNALLIRSGKISQRAVPRFPRLPLPPRQRLPRSPRIPGQSLPRPLPRLPLFLPPGTVPDRLF